MLATIRHGGLRERLCENLREKQREKRQRENQNESPVERQESQVEIRREAQRDNRRQLVVRQERRPVRGPESHRAPIRREAPEWNSDRPSSALFDPRIAKPRQGHGARDGFLHELAFAESPDTRLPREVNRQRPNRRPQRSGSRGAPRMGQRRPEAASSSTQPVASSSAQPRQKPRPPADEAVHFRQIPVSHLMRGPAYAWREDKQEVMLPRQVTELPGATMIRRHIDVFANAILDNILEEVAITLTEIEQKEPVVQRHHELHHEEIRLANMEEQLCAKYGVPVDSSLRLYEDAPRTEPQPSRGCRLTFSEDCGATSLVPVVDFIPTGDARSARPSQPPETSAVVPPVGAIATEGGTKAAEGGTKAVEGGAIDTESSAISSEIGAKATKDANVPPLESGSVAVCDHDVVSVPQSYTLGTEVPKYEDVKIGAYGGTAGDVLQIDGSEEEPLRNIVVSRDLCKRLDLYRYRFKQHSVASREGALDGVLKTWNIWPSLAIDILDDVITSVAKEMDDAVSQSVDNMVHRETSKI